MTCEDCVEWEYFEGIGFGCFGRRMHTPINAEECEEFAQKEKIQDDKKEDGIDC